MPYSGWAALYSSGVITRSPEGPTGGGDGWGGWYNCGDIYPSLKIYHCDDIHDDSGYGCFGGSADQVTHLSLGTITWFMNDNEVSDCAYDWTQPGSTPSTYSNLANYGCCRAGSSGNANGIGCAICHKNLSISHYNNISITTTTLYMYYTNGSWHFTLDGDYSGSGSSTLQTVPNCNTCTISNEVNDCETQAGCS